MRLTYVQINNEQLAVSNKKHEYLGSIDWCEEWKCYVWFQSIHIQMSSGCLQQIVNKIRDLDKLQAPRLLLSYRAYPRLNDKFIYLLS